MKLPTIPKNLKGKKVLIRVDINSPVRNGMIIENPRFKITDKCIKDLSKKGARVVVLAHQGRRGQSDFLKLKQHAKILGIKYVDDIFGEKAVKGIKNLKNGEAVLLKNVRSYKYEGDPVNDIYYKKFCQNFDLYINDAFSVSHRRQASIILPPKFLSSYAGFNLKKEINSLKKFSSKDTKDKVFILGGAKIEDYMSILDSLKNKNNKVLLGGVPANLFLIAKGINLGYENKWLKKHSFYKLLPKLSEIYNKYKERVILPVDFGVIENNDIRINVTMNDLPFNYKIFDIGKESVRLFEEHLRKSRNIFMKGPLGFSEVKGFEFGTIELLKYLSKIGKNKFIVLGGGHLATTISKYKIKDNFDHISLSGGALLKFISGEKLPGIEALRKD